MYDVYHAGAKLFSAPTLEEAVAYINQNLLDRAIVKLSEEVVYTSTLLLG